MWKKASESPNQVLPPARLRVVGIAEFPFELVGDPTVGAAMATLDDACDSRSDESNVILASALDEVDATAAAVILQDCLDSRSEGSR